MLPIVWPYAGTRQSNEVDSHEMLAGEIYPKCGKRISIENFAKLHSWFDLEFVSFSKKVINRQPSVSN